MRKQEGKYGYIRDKLTSPSFPRTSYMRRGYYNLFFETMFQASEEYREHSTHKTQRAKRTRQKQEQRIVEQHSSTIQESSTVSKKNFDVVRLNNILLPLLEGTVTCKC